jgi:hypothetical protein
MKGLASPRPAALYTPGFGLSAWLAKGGVVTSRSDCNRSAPDRQAALASAPPGPARAIISVFIIAWLVWQLAVPLSYYLGDNVDDERFAWRMFSGVWLLQKSCTASVTEVRSQSAADARGIRKVNLDRTLHSTWVGQLKKKNRPLVVEKFLRTRCDGDPSVTEVEYTRTCSAAPHARIPPTTLRFDCRAGEFTRP